MKAFKCSLAVLIPAVYIKPVGLLKHNTVVGTPTTNTTTESTKDATTVKNTPHKRPTNKKEK